MSKLKTVTKEECKRFILTHKGPIVHSSQTLGASPQEWYHYGDTMVARIIHPYDPKVDSFEYEILEGDDD